MQCLPLSFPPFRITIPLNKITFLRFCLKMRDFDLKSAGDVRRRPAPHHFVRTESFHLRGGANPTPLYPTPLSRTAEARLPRSAFRTAGTTDGSPITPLRFQERRGAGVAVWAEPRTPNQPIHGRTRSDPVPEAIHFKGAIHPTLVIYPRYVNHSSCSRYAINSFSSVTMLYV